MKKYDTNFKSSKKMSEKELQHHKVIEDDTNEKKFSRILGNEIKHEIKSNRFNHIAIRILKGLNVNTEEEIKSMKTVSRKVDQSKLKNVLKYKSLSKDNLMKYLDCDWDSITQWDIDAGKYKILVCDKDDPTLFTVNPYLVYEMMIKVVYTGFTTIRTNSDGTPRIDNY